MYEILYNYEIGLEKHVHERDITNFPSVYTDPRSKFTIRNEISPGAGYILIHNKCRWPLAMATPTIIM